MTTIKLSMPIAATKRLLEGLLREDPALMAILRGNKVEAVKVTVPQTVCKRCGEPYNLGEKPGCTNVNCPWFTKA